MCQQQNALNTDCSSLDMFSWKLWQPWFINYLLFPARPMFNFLVSNCQSFVNLSLMPLYPDSFAFGGNLVGPCFWIQKLMRRSHWGLNAVLVLDYKLMHAGSAKNLSNLSIKKKKKESLFSQSFTGWLHFVLLLKNELDAAPLRRRCSAQICHFVLRPCRESGIHVKWSKKRGIWGRTMRRMECGCCVGSADVAWEKDLGRFWEEGCNTGD